MGRNGFGKREGKGPRSLVAAVVVIMQDTLDSWSNRKYINHAAILRPPKTERNLEIRGETELRRNGVTAVRRYEDE